ncbi:tetratricopeptide repeat protein [Ruegeria sp. 2012CJ41-6]|uniref:Tetratricopeptide repeat protein n=1 Tax=Ruegeria spongiae TaxID=2942209 RepID=A0ABT0Q093_9RHOB|nr:tetratricopeptide repeat protein [Ruegeria spongiae]MCL6282613.1 tetratricopeptide repeat protein [Ruegeria spongiae]
MSKMLLGWSIPIAPEGLFLRDRQHEISSQALRQKSTQNMTLSQARNPMATRRLLRCARSRTTRGKAARAWSTLPRSLCRVALTVALCGSAAIAQTASLKSSDPAVNTHHRAKVEASIKCPKIEGWSAQMKAFEAAATHKWDRATMGCAILYGTEAVEQLSAPSSALWAILTFRADKVETTLGVLAAHVEYFDVLDKRYSDPDLSVALSSELAVRWEQTRASGAEIIARIKPLLSSIPEARILRAAFATASTRRDTTSAQRIAALRSATVDLERAIADNPEALEGTGQRLLGQILLLPAKSGGDTQRGIALLEAAHQLNPNDLSIHRMLVRAYLANGENSKATAMLLAALEADQAMENPQDYVDDTKDLGELALQAGQPDISERLMERRAHMLADRPELLARGGLTSFGDELARAKPDALISRSIQNTWHQRPR